MKVESFEQSISHNGTSEATDLARQGEHLALLESLGLVAQSEKFTANQDTGNAPTFDFPRVSARQRKIIATLCPQQTKLEEYSSEVIPLEVLQVIAKAKALTGEQGFERFLVCHPEDAMIPDPFVIGIRKHAVPGHTWTNSVEYLIARWGEHLDTWEKMYDKARKIATEQRKAQLRKIRAKLDVAEASTASWFDEVTSLGTPYISGLD